MGLFLQWYALTADQCMAFGIRYLQQVKNLESYMIDAKEVMSL